MEITAVKWAREEIQNDGVAESQHVTALCQTGRTLLHVVYIDSSAGVRKVDVPLTEARFMRPLQLRGVLYPVPRAARKMLESGRRLGITEGARSILREAIGNEEEEG